MDRRTLFPPIDPYRTDMISVGDGHTIYVEECGNPQGKPVLMVHGGPGGGSNPTMRRFHNPEHYRIILFDQRGCGRSTPNASLDNNTTWDLVADMERIRSDRGIDSWQLCGGSWGSTLSLAYAETHADRVSELILRGIFTLRREEVEWFYSSGCRWIYPDTYAPFEAHIPEAERDDVIAAYHRRLTSDDAQVRLEAARLWSRWEGSTLSLMADPARVAAFGADTYALAFARIECHYFVNRGFFSRDDQLLADVGKIAHIPGVIVQGRYDVVTPVRTAWELAAQWPNARLEIVADAGHAMTEPGIVHEIVTAAEAFYRSS